MTREEAVKVLDGAEVMLLNRTFKDYQQATLMALTALRPVSWGQVEKMWKGEWKIITTHNGCTPDQDCVCSRCGASGIPNKAFCDSCGAPMTDEAVQMVLERLEELKNADYGNAVCFHTV